MNLLMGLTTAFVWVLLISTGIRIIIRIVIDTGEAKDLLPSLALAFSVFNIREEATS